jgi:ATP-dependent Lon protease
MPSDGQEAVLDELPVFPLAAVLFPGSILPLHIFEERYQAMIRHAIENSGQFGLSYKGDAAVSIETPPEIGSVGCAAKIKAVLPLEEGRMNILSAGLLRYRIAEFTQTEPFLIAKVSTFSDDLEPGADLSRLHEDTKEITGQFLKLLQSLNDMSALSNMELPSAPEALSMIISSAMPIDDEDKQRLLEMTSTRLRLSSLRHYLLQSISRLQIRVGKHDGAKQNGHNKLNSR